MRFPPILAFGAWRVVEALVPRPVYLVRRLTQAPLHPSTRFLEPKVATNKICDDAVHFIVGFDTTDAKNQEAPGALRGGTWSTFQSTK